jgi:hypothetical protein
MSTRGNQIYAAADEFTDGYALGVSTDDGMTWQSVMNYGQVAAILGCVKQACQMTCATEVSVSLWDMSICSADPPATVDGGAGAADASTGGGGSGGAGGNGGQKHSSSACAIAPGDAGGWLLPTGALAALVILLGRRRARR